MINTLIGLLKWKRMPYRIKIDSAIFQSPFGKVLREDVKNICNQDDICIGATNENELKNLHRLEYIKKRWNDNK